MSEKQTTTKLTEICDGIYRLKVPMGSGSVNSFLLRDGRGGWVLIDTGYATTVGLDGWQKTMQELGFGFGDISKLLCTHFHGDHTGLTGWFERNCDAPIYMHPLDIDAYHTMWDSDERHVTAMVNHMRSYGMQTMREEEMKKRLYEIGTAGMDLCTHFEALHDGDMFPVEGGTLYTILSPGHTSGHCMFYLPERRLMFAGDMLLPATYSPVGLRPYGGQEPIKSILESLNLLQSGVLSREGLVCLPGHGWPIAEPGKRAAEEEAYYRERIEAFYARCRQGEACPYQIAEENAAGSGWRFHMVIAESIAYLEYLASEGRVRRTQRDGVYYFSAADATESLSWEVKA